MFERLFSSMQVGGKTLANRVVMLPVYLGYARPDGSVGRILLDHYESMAQSGAAMVVVESSTVDRERGTGGGRVIGADTDANLEGLAKLAQAIKARGALTCIQINHTGRFANVAEPIAPSNVDTSGLGRVFHEPDQGEIRELAELYAHAALRVKKCGFDMVELHGATGYLLTQFLSPWTNRRKDSYGGSLENRMRFPLEVTARVREVVGNFPVGYRFLADEYLGGGLTTEETLPFARELDRAGVAYLSVTGGTWESFLLPQVMEASRKPGFMAHLAGQVKQEVSVPVIAAGRIATGTLAEEILENGQADLIGLGRPLFTDPLWVKKVKEGKEDQVIACNPECGDVCMQMVMQKRPALCSQWSPEKTRLWKSKIKQDD